MGIVIGSPMQQGALSQVFDKETLDRATWLSPPRRRQLERLYDLVRQSGIPLPEMCLRFVLSNPAVSTVLTGARTADEVRLNVEAGERGPLPADILAELDAIAATLPFRPFEEPAGLPFRGVHAGLGVMA
jgi:aryl-alcohol dehydrogenase-like predicted oxidoreductase